MVKNVGPRKEKKILAEIMALTGIIILFFSFSDYLGKNDFSWIGLFLLVVGITSFREEKDWSELSFQERRWRIVLLSIIGLFFFFFFLLYFLPQ